MTTKAELREMVRRRVEDTSLTAPLWDDETLDDALADALARYGAIVPMEERVTVTVTEGDEAITVSGLESGAAIVRVVDPSGGVVPRFEPEDGAAGQGWRWWAGAIRLALPARAGDWYVEWRAPRRLPALDADEAPVRSGDEAAVSLLAAASALRVRAVDEAKRGGRGTDALLALASAWERTGERQARARSRTVRSFVAHGG
jgi:hypothetical protein